MLDENKCPQMEHDFSIDGLEFNMIPVIGICSQVYA